LFYQLSRLYNRQLALILQSVSKNDRLRFIFCGTIDKTLIKYMKGMNLLQSEDLSVKEIPKNTWVYSEDGNEQTGR